MAHATNLSSVCSAFLLTLSGAFAPEIAPIFVQIGWAWILCLGRPTVANLLRSVPEKFQRHWTTAYRFFSKTRWEPDDIFRILVQDILHPLLPADPPWILAADDTTAQKYGPRVAFAAWFRDPVRSTPNQKVFHKAHNWVILCLLIPIPFLPAKYLHVPLLARLYRKQDLCTPDRPFRTRQQLVAEMVRLLQTWLPSRTFLLTVDGQYPSEELVRELPEDVPLLSRLRIDAALFELPPPHNRKVGAPRKKGARLPSVQQIAAHATFQKRFVYRYGERKLVLLHSFVCLWYGLAKNRPIRVVIVRDPQGQEKDDFFFSTDPSLPPHLIVQYYAARWGIEELIREVKQSLGFDDTQSWTPQAVLRQAPLALLLHAVTVLAYIQDHPMLETPPRRHAPPSPPPSFHDMLAALRFSHWQDRISAVFGDDPKAKKILRPLRSALATCA
jgi:hypothetical protein